MAKLTAKAAVYDAPNTPFEVRNYPMCDVRSDEVLVHISMSTICRSDIHSWEGYRPNPCPGILGHEIVGVIDQLGEEDPHFLGGFAEYCYVVPGTGILKLPDELSDEEATPINCGIATMASLTEASEIGMGDVVVIQGLGLLGLYGCAMAKARGARRVIGLDSVKDRLKTAKKFGADFTIDISGRSEDDVVDAVRKLAPPDGVDVVIEVCGVPDVVTAGLKMLRIGGRYTLGGIVTPDANVTVDANTFVKKWATLKGVHNYHPRHLIQALDFVVANRDRFPFKDIVDSKFKLTDLNEAFKRASEHSVLRAAVTP